MALQFVTEADLEGKNVIARFDFNVPLDKETGKINDTTRVDLALPTIKYILENGAKRLILMSHLGRPKGEANPKFSLEPVATYLADQLGLDVTLTEKAVDSGLENLLQLGENKIILLENIRFHKEETENNLEFAKKLASYADVYVNDAFGTAHRKHASTYAINAYFPKKAYAGFLIKKEIEALIKVTEKPEKPFVGIIGGAKVADKITTIERLLPLVSNLLIGGAMAYPFLKAKGREVGTSLCSDEDVKLAKSLLNQDTGGKIILPNDHLVSATFGGPAETSNDIAEDKMGLDIGPHTTEKYQSIIANAKTVFWNGPMGLFENESYNKGTFGVARALADCQGFTLVGGGDSVSAINLSGLADKVSHVSTGGGATLEYIEKGGLPGIAALKFGVSL